MAPIVDTGNGKYCDISCRVSLCNWNARIHIDLSFRRIPSVKKVEFRTNWIDAIRRDEGPKRNWTSV
ncbi:hypothetical protein ACJMK2_044000, partial [Sinanodonta woodiana]